MPKISCLQCGSRLTYPPEKAGRRAKCPKCKTSLSLPNAGEVTTAASRNPAWADALNIPDGCGDRTGLALSAHGRHLVTADGETRATLWDSKTGRVVKTFSCEPPHCTCVATDPEGRYVLSGGGTARSDQQQPLHLWEVASGKPVRQFVGHRLGILSVAFLPDGRTAISGSLDFTMRLWDVSTGEQLAELVAPRTLVTYKGHGNRGSEYYLPAPVSNIRCSPDGRYCTASDVNHLVRLWDLRDKSVVQVKEQQKGASAFTRDGRHVITAGVHGVFHVWSVATGQDDRVFRSRIPSVNSIDTTPDGKYLVYGGADSGCVHFADLDSGEVGHALDAGGNYVRVVRVASGGKVLAAITDKAVRVWRLTD